MFSTVEEMLAAALAGYGFVPPEDDWSPTGHRKCWHCEVATTEDTCWSCGRDDGLRPFRFVTNGGFTMRFGGGDAA